MRINSIQANNRDYSQTKPSFGLKVDEKIVQNVCKELSDKSLTRYMKNHVAHLENLKSVGKDTTELFLSSGKGDTVNFSLRVPTSKGIKEVVLSQSPKDKLLKSWFGITQEKIQKAEKMLEDTNS